MFDPAGIDDLARRKRLLAAESDLNRQALRLEFCQVRTSLAGVTELMESGRSLWRVLLVAAPVAGLIVSRKHAKWKGLLNAALAGWQVFNRFQPLWTAFKQGREKTPAASPPPGRQAEGDA